MQPIMKIKIILSFFTIILSFAALNAQALHDGLSQNYYFSKDSLTTKEEMSVYARKGIPILKIQVEGKLQTGALIVEILTPSGKLQEVLKLDGNKKTASKSKSTTRSLNNNSETVVTSISSEQSGPSGSKIAPKLTTFSVDKNDKVLGQINKTVYNPEEGWWIVRMTPTNADAVINIKLSF